MKKISVKISMLALSLGLLLNSCAKKDAEPDDSAQQTTTASDQSNVTNESDQAVNDANTVLSGSSTNGRTDGNGPSLTGATIDSTIAGNWTTGKYVITYNGNDITGTRSRSGVITLQLTNGPWSHPGCVLTITFSNYKVTRNATGKSITFNGTKTVTNVTTGNNGSGYKYWNLPTDGVTSIDHTVRGSFAITFDDGTVRTWEIARHRKVTRTSNLAFDLTLSGDTSINDVANTDVWGVNRAGENFQGAITTPIVFSTSCFFEPVSGVYTLQGLKRNLTVTFGVNSDGTISTATCPYGFKFDWTNLSNVQKEVIHAY
ncbi:MAG TPA: hypothetical protein VK766_07690 [Cytophagaceae bacterium]|jgi:hypothetical protein|nr:hypothetical protein [Cytophagaceae bacterium]